MKSENRRYHEEEFRSDESHRISETDEEKQGRIRERERIVRILKEKRGSITLADTSIRQALQEVYEEIVKEVII